ncbi:DUF7287 family protein [Natronorubrum sulfidifaciens]|uniref:Uncharacterized protein n=1 Tax=Natronorubrum sulfidifaciens JCM 14089 TaxID=1230460 RepID=L9W4S6_9EURY|nr:hypothetical protein [Natronorubrum sulfidifaciens]ELY44459.1 hypothetical protein C495_11169 [Natronorubrum sulfidifaciens JCM 14089]
MSRKRTQNGSKRTRGRRQRTVSLSLRDRGQTTQDFAVGIGVFILAVAFVFSFLPTILTPFDSSVSGGQTAQADRIADRLVHNLSDSDTSPNAINDTAFNETDGELEDRVGLRTAGDQVSVQIEQLNESETVNDMVIGDQYNGQSAASSARIVTLDDNPEGCETACRLVVRVW